MGIGMMGESRMGEKGEELVGLPTPRCRGKGKMWSYIQRGTEDFSLLISLYSMLVVTIRDLMQRKKVEML